MGRMIHLDRVIGLRHVATKEKGRYALECVHFDLDRDECVATDGRIILVSKIAWHECEGRGTAFNGLKQFSLHSKDLGELKAKRDEIWCLKSVDDTHAICEKFLGRRVEETKRIRVVDGTFPPYESVLSERVRGGHKVVREINPELFVLLRNASKTLGEGKYTDYVRMYIDDDPISAIRLEFGHSLDEGDAPTVWGMLMPRTFVNEALCDEAGRSIYEKCEEDEEDDVEEQVKEGKE